MLEPVTDLGQISEGEEPEVNGERTIRRYWCGPQRGWQ